MNNRKTVMLLNNLYLKDEAYCETSETELMFVRKQRADIAMLILLMTSAFESVLLSDFALWKLPFGVVLFLPLALYISYNRRLIIDKASGLVYNQHYLYNFLYRSTRVIQLHQGEELYVGYVTDIPEDVNRIRYTLYAKRKSNIYMFDFNDFDTVALLKNVLEENFNIDIVYSPVVEPI